MPICLSVIRMAKPAVRADSHFRYAVLYSMSVGMENLYTLRGYDYIPDGTVRIEGNLGLRYSSLYSQAGSDIYDPDFYNLGHQPYVECLL